MLSNANIDVVGTLRLFKAAGLNVAFLVPTPTGLYKSILDATDQVRELLFKNGLHDFSLQAQGAEHKIKLPTVILSQGMVKNTETSLYRPKTKQGDPRIWPNKLATKELELASPGDLLALLPKNDGLIIINCSQSNLGDLLDTNGVIFRNIILQAVVGPSNIAAELHDMLRQIHKKGYIKTLRPGDTGVGYTLETELGITANNSPKPDYKGIELKSKRKGPNKNNLFSKVPNWDLSRVKTNSELLFTRGKYNSVRNQTRLFHTISAKLANSYDLQLKLDPKKDQLQQIYTAQKPDITDVLWEMPVLLAALREKHYETFWVTAETKGARRSADECFWYTKLKHTGKLDESAFATLLEAGEVTVDYTLWEHLPTASNNKGYSFKLKSRSLDLLFDRVDTYDLSQ